MNIGELIATLGVDAAGLEQAKREMAKFEQSMQTSVNTINKSLESVGKKMQAVGKDMTKYLSLPISIAGGFAFKMASDMEEAINKVDVAFGANSDEIKKWSEITLQSIGLAQSSALDMVALFGDMSTSMGYSTESASKMSMNLVKLAGDLASFKNIKIEIAQTALAGVFTGETESLKRLGIVMTEVNLQEYALSQGIRKRINEMSQVEKVQLRYNYILEMTKNSQGDFMRTSEGAANQMRIFSQSLKETGVAFGKILLPIITPLIKRLNEWLQRIKELSESQKKWILGIAGVAAVTGPLLVSLGWMTANVLPGLVKMVMASVKAFNALKIAMLSNPYTAIAVGVAAIVASFALLKKRVEESTVKLSEFDKQMITEQSTLNSLIGILKTSSKGTLERNAAINTLNEQYKDYMPNLLSEKSTLEDIEIAQKAINEAMIKNIALKSRQNELTESANKYFETEKIILTKIRTSLELVNKSIAGVGVAAFQDLINQTEELGIIMTDVGGIQMVQFLDPTLDAIYEFSKEYGLAMDDVQSSLSKILGAKGTYQKEFQKINEFYQSYSDALSKTTNTTKTTTDNINENLSMSFNALDRYETKLKSLKFEMPTFEETDYTKFFDRTQESLSVMDELSLKLADITLKNSVFSDSIDDVNLALESNKQQIAFVKSIMETLWEAGFRPGNELLDQYIAKLKELTEVQTNLIVEITKFEAVTEILDNIAGAFSTIGYALNNTAGNWVSFVGKVLAAIPSLISSIVAISTAQKAQAISGAVAGANTIPFPLNLVAIGTSIAATLIGLATSVPKLAQGGIVTGPTLAMVGDNPARREAIVPLEKAGQMGFSGSQNVQVNIKGVLDGRNIYWVNKNYEDFLKKTT